MKVFDTQCKQYDAWYDAHKYAFLSELAALRKVIPRDEKGLEIGVGTGRFAAELGISMGIDSSHAMLKQASARGVNVRWGVGEDIYFLNETFDFVAIITTLCFVENVRKVLEESARVLKKRGHIIIGIIDKESFLGKSYRKKKSIFYRHAHLFTIQEVTALLKKAGFRAFSYYQTITKLPEKMIAVEKPKKGFGKGGFVVVSAKK